MLNINFSQWNENLEMQLTDELADAIMEAYELDEIEEASEEQRDEVIGIFEDMEDYDYLYSPMKNIIQNLWEIEI